MRRVRTSIFAVEMQLILYIIVYVCSLMYSGCKAHGPYFHPWPVRLYNIFAHYLLNGMIFGKKKVIEHKMRAWIFCTTFSEAFLILTIDWDMVKKYIYWSSYKVPVILGLLKWTLKFLETFRKTIKYKLSNSFCGSRVFPWQTDRYDEANSHSSYFVKGPKICLKATKYRTGIQRTDL